MAAFNKPNYSIHYFSFYSKDNNIVNNPIINLLAFFLFWHVNLYNIKRVGIVLLKEQEPNILKVINKFNYTVSLINNST
jgi:hypothetical protein